MVEFVRHNIHCKVNGKYRLWIATKIQSKIPKDIKCMKYIRTSDVNVLLASSLYISRKIIRTCFFLEILYQIKYILYLWLLQCERGSQQGTIGLSYWAELLLQITFHQLPSNFWHPYWNSNQHQLILSPSYVTDSKWND